MTRMIDDRSAKFLLDDDSTCRLLARTVIDEAELGQARQVGDVLEDWQVELYGECSFS